MLAGDLLDAGFILSWHTGHDQILVGCHTEITLMDLGNFATTGFQRFTRVIQNPSVFDKQGQMEFSIHALSPTNTVTPFFKFIGFNRREQNTCALFHFRFKGVGTDPVQRVFGFGIFTVHPIAPIPLGGHYSFSNSQRVLQRDKAKVVCLTRISAGISMGHGKATTYQYVKANQLPLLSNRDKAQVVGVHVYIILRRDNHCRFEFTWQVGITEDWLLLGRLQLLFV